MEERLEQPELSSEIVTVVFVDIVDYTNKTNHLNRHLFIELHNAFDRICISLCKKYGGSVIKKIGDAFLFAFKSPTNAILCGIHLQNSFESYNKEQKPHEPIKIRVAIHTGEVILREGDIYGDAVNIAARIEGVAGPNEIVFSGAVFLAMNKNEIPFVHVGLFKLKGVSQPVRLFRVKGHYDRILRRKKVLRKRYRLVKRVIITIMVLSIVGISAYLILPSIGFVW